MLNDHCKKVEKSAPATRVHQRTTMIPYKGNSKAPLVVNWGLPLSENFHTGGYEHTCSITILFHNTTHNFYNRGCNKSVFKGNAYQLFRVLETDNSFLYSIPFLSIPSIPSSLSTLKLAHPFPLMILLSFPRFFPFLTLNSFSILIFSLRVWKHTLLYIKIQVNGSLLI